MWIAGAVLLAIIIAEAAYVLSTGLEKTATVADEDAVELSVEPLHVEGTTLLDSKGQPVVMRGISIGWHNLWPRFYNSEAVVNLHDGWGCKLFRAAIGADDLGEMLNGTNHHPGYISDPQGALEKLFAVVDGAIASGSYVIVDWHSHVLHLAEATEFFTAVANRYKGVPNVIYELFNEPVGDSWEDLKAYAESLIATITSIDTSHPLILMGCPRWDQAIELPAADPITTYDNVMYTMHFYAGTHKQWLRDATDAAMAAGLPVFISECAAMTASGDGPLDMESWKEWSDWAAARGLNIVLWSFSDKDESYSMLKPEASSEGPWPEEVIKPWGFIARDFVK
ncbi:MAG: glycoside hydrolase family 5 protein [Bacteroidales bacterium]|nr:glycoside hydrolase family 5 protein [Bacteroidales bacterium]